MTCDRERFPIVLRRSSSAPDTAHPNHRLHATIKQLDGEFRSVPCRSTGRLAEALHGRGEAIAVAETTAPTAGKICDSVGGYYGRGHIHNRKRHPDGRKFA
jgi:hypothetical protein